MRPRSLVLASLLLLALPAAAADPPVREWAVVYGSSFEDRGADVAVDALDNAYVVGETYGAFDGQINPGAKALCLTRFAPSGAREWTRLLGPTDSYAEGHGVAVDGSAVYVCGQTWGPIDGQAALGNGDLLLARYDTAGTLQWVRIWGSSTIDQANAVAVAPDGIVYVTGWTTGAFDGQAEIGGRDAFYSEFLADGTREGSRIWGGSADDEPQAIAVDADANVYVAGTTEGAIDGQAFGGTNDVFLTRHDAVGDRVWTRLWGGSGINRGEAVVLDGATPPNAVVAGLGGSFNGQLAVGSTDAFLMKVDPLGVTQWTRMWGSVGADYAFDVAFRDGVGFTVVGQAAAATFDGVAGMSGGYLTRFDAGGVRQWTERFGTSSTEVHGIAHVDDDHVHTAGTTFGPIDDSTYVDNEDLFDVLWGPDVAVPVITSGPTVTDASYLAPRVAWGTDIPADSAVEHGPSGGGGTSTTTSPALVTAHSVTLPELLPGASYRVRVSSTTASGASVESGWIVFVTSSPPPADTMTFEIGRGSIVDRAKAAKDTFKIKCTYTLDDPGVVPFVPEEHDALVTISATDVPYVIPIPRGDDGWRTSRRKHVWKSPRGVLPKVKLVVHRNKPSMLLDLKRHEFGGALGGAVRIEFVLGDDRGSHESPWRLRKPGRLRFP